MKGLGLAVVLFGAGICWVSGCSPDLKEGVYGCATGEQCPDNWYCHDNDRCYSTPQSVSDDTPQGGQEGSGGNGSGGSDSSGGSDASGGTSAGELHAECTADADCASGECLISFDDQVNTGRCTVSCVGDNDCASGTDFGTEGLCTNGQCIESCSDPAGCPMPLTCFEITDMAGPGRYGCYENTRAGTAGVLACGPTQGACPYPSSCQVATLDAMNGGVCGGTCEIAAGCGMPGNSCIQLFDDTAVCLQTCTNANVCSNGLDCITLGDEGTFCGPVAWNNADLPLSEFGGPPM